MNHIDYLLKHPFKLLSLVDKVEIKHLGPHQPPDVCETFITFGETGHFNPVNALSVVPHGEVETCLSFLFFNILPTQKFMSRAATGYRYKIQRKTLSKKIVLM